MCESKYINQYFLKNKNSEIKHPISPQLSKFSPYYGSNSKVLFYHKDNDFIEIFFFEIIMCKKLWLLVMPLHQYTKNLISIMHNIETKKYLTLIYAAKNTLHLFIFGIQFSTHQRRSVRREPIFTFMLSWKCN